MSKGSKLNPSQHISSEHPIPAWADRMNQLGRDGIPFLFILDFKLDDPVVIPLHEINEQDLRFEIRGFPSGHIKGSVQSEIILEKIPVGFDEYHRGFDKVMTALKAGDSYLLNLCYATRLHGIKNLEDIYDMAKAPYKLFIKNRLVVFSPECFVTIDDGIIRTYPMKGTMDAIIEDAEKKLLEDVKEQEEHATVVDLLRNDLSIVSKNVTVEKYRFITRIRSHDKELLQCSSEISGVLNGDYRNSIGSIINNLLPAGSVTGAPKKRTVELIESIEPDPRGYYTGVFGVFDGSRLDSAVMIRMIEQRADGFYYRSGGGITYQSDVEQEYRELLDKVYIPV